MSSHIRQHALFEQEDQREGSQTAGKTGNLSRAVKTMLVGQRADVRDDRKEGTCAEAFEQGVGGIASFGGYGTTLKKRSDDFDKGPLEGYSEGDLFELCTFGCHRRRILSLLSTIASSALHEPRCDGIRKIKVRRALKIQVDSHRPSRRNTVRVTIAKRY